MNELIHHGDAEGATMNDGFARSRHRGHRWPRKSGACERKRLVCKGIENRAFRFPSSKTSMDGLFARSS